MRGATRQRVGYYHRMLFQSTLLMRGATSAGVGLSPAPYFNPRSSCEERLPPSRASRLFHAFQSTLLMRGATGQRYAAGQSLPYFNPRSSCEERRPRFMQPQKNGNFNPRSSCEERL